MPGKNSTLSGLDQLADEEIAAISPGHFMQYASPYPYKLAPHLQLLNQALLRAATLPDQRIIVSMPPRHGKSELTSIGFPAWYMGQKPGAQIILGAYEADFAAGFGGKARDMFEEYGPDVYGWTVDPDNNAKTKWQTIPSYKGANTRRVHKATMQTAGLGGSITGKGADVLLIDDPVKNAEAVETKQAREKMWDWWRSTAYTRLMPGGSAVVVQTRWHQDDLAGRLIQQSLDGEEHWEVMNLPAICDSANDLLGRPEGEPLWPEQWPLSALLQKKMSVGPYWWAAMYQGRPVPLEGGILKHEYMKHRYREAPAMVRVVQSIDSAFKTGVANDYSVIATWGTDGINFYLLDLWRAKVEFPELKQAIRDQYYKWNPSGVYVEDAASGQSIIQEFQRESMIPVIAKNVKGNDISRAHAVSGLFQAGKVKLPVSASWLADWIEEHVAFPNGMHDDQIATTYYALEELAYMAVPIMEFV
jgi:predicted phage terminase large subunit-like protein